MICSADPGKYKTGFAITDDCGNLIFSAVIPTAGQDIIAEAFKNKTVEKIAVFKCEGKIPDTFDINEIYIGNGTTHKEFIKIFDDTVKVNIVDEYGTTLEGRKLYWELHPPRGIWNIFPTSLRVPPREVDDLAAWAIIRKVVKKNNA